jgi:hypothetical protein
LYRKKITYVNFKLSFNNNSPLKNLWAVIAPQSGAKRTFRTGELFFFDLWAKPINQKKIIHPYIPPFCGGEAAAYA